MTYDDFSHALVTFSSKKSLPCNKYSKRNLTPLQSDDVSVPASLSNWPDRSASFLLDDGVDQVRLFLSACPI